MEKKKSYLNKINYFRGIAIILIVIGHCDSFGITRFNENTTKLAEIIIPIVHGGTAFFVFISGFLFHYIYFQNFQLKLFLIKKIKYVLIPFLIFSSLDIWYYITRFIISYIFHFNNYYLYLNKLKSFDLVKIFLLGHSEINIALWYVPFIMLIFIFSMFFIKFITVNFKIQLWIIIILMLFSLLIHRRYESNVFALFNNVIYFTPVYLLGIFVSKNINLFYSKLNGKEFYLLIIIFLIVIMQLQQVKLENISLLNEINIWNIDLMIIQKSIISLLLIIYFNKFEHKEIRLLNLFAENSYGIFFIHGNIIWLLNVFILKTHIKYVTNSIFIFFISAIIVLSASLLTTLVIKRIFSKKSKYIIGC